MFDSLLGKKFTNKCKHSMKCINTRIVPIRRKKQAMLRFLRKDVADLVANGLDINAFGRIDALIVEINHTSCYDMIEQYCKCILNQLPSLQKQRECPQEAEEAVSTLIFAAARFPDLPELCDLRRAFAERYGGHLETSVSAEFVEKIQKKSFSTDKKLRLMQDIAKEFSVTWDCRAFEQKLSNNSSAPAVDRPKKGTHISNGKNEPPNMSNVRKEADIDARKAEIPCNPRYEAAPHMSIVQKQVQPEPRDIHVVSSIRSGLPHVGAEKARKVFDDEPENVAPCCTNSEAPPYFKPKGRQNGSQKDDQINEGIRRSRSPWAREGPGLIGLAREAVGAVKSTDERAADIVPPPYTRPKGGSKIENTYDRSRRDGEEELDPSVQERQPIKPVNFNNDRPGYAVPPYVKLKANNLSPHERSNGAEDKDHNKDELVGDEKPKPVSVRRKHTKPLAAGEIDSAIDGRRRQGGRRGPSTHEDDYDEEEKIRNREHKLSKSKEVDGSVDYERHANRTPSGRRGRGGRRTTGTTYEGDYDGDEEERVMDRLLVHYSKKGTENESSKMSTPMRRVAPPGELVGDEGKLMHPGPARSLPHPPGRAVSLPPEPVSPKEAVKGPARAASMHPDLLSPNGGRVHPRLPDYDELAARFIALRKA